MALKRCLNTISIFQPDIEMFFLDIDHDISNLPFLRRISRQFWSNDSPISILISKDMFQVKPETLKPVTSSKGIILSNPS